jgi:hypothetical protein
MKSINIKENDFISFPLIKTTPSGKYYELRHIINFNHPPVKIIKLIRRST